MATAFGLVGVVVFIFAVVGLAAGVTWTVVRYSPNPATKREKKASAAEEPS